MDFHSPLFFPHSGSSVSSEGGDEGLKRQLEEAQKQLRDKDEEIKFLNVKLFESSSVSCSPSLPSCRQMYADIDLSPNCCCSCPSELANWMVVVVLCCRKREKNMIYPIANIFCNLPRHTCF